MINAKNLKRQLTNIRFATLSYGLRHEGTVDCKSPETARYFAENFLLSLAVAGVDFSDSELIDIYEEIHKLVYRKNEISTSEIPYAQKKKWPFRTYTLVVKGNTVSLRDS